MRTVPRVNAPGRHNKRVIRMNYEPAMTFDEIAAAMKLNKQTVWVIYARAVDKIRTALRTRAEQYAALLDHEEAGRGPVYPDWRES
jgi:hypothetical protein